METKDIVASLNMAAVSKRPLPNRLLLAIDEALKERDELRAGVEWESARVDALHLAQATDEETIRELKQQLIIAERRAEIAGTGQEVASELIATLLDNYDTLRRAFDIAVQDAADFRAKYEDFMEAYQNVIDEKCASDEKHCTCVPFLRMEIERLRNAMDFLENNLIAYGTGYGIEHNEMILQDEYANEISAYGKDIFECIEDGKRKMAELSEDYK